MKVLAALTALVTVLIGSATLTKIPDATPIAPSVAITESQSDNAPPYIRFDPSDWR